MFYERYASRYKIFEICIDIAAFGKEVKPENLQHFATMHNLPTGQAGNRTE